MRIAVDLTPIRADGSAGGVTGLIIELLKALKEKQNIDFVFLCTDWNKEYLTSLFGNMAEYKIVIAGNESRSVRVLKKIMHKLKLTYPQRSGAIEYKADLLFCPFSAVNYKIDGIPAVSTINDIQHEFYPQFFTPEELQHRRNFYKNIVSNAERIICISDYTKDTFCEKYGYNREKASTVYIAIQGRFDREREDNSILDKLAVESDNYIVFPANFWEHKNHKLLLNAFGMYAAQHPQGKLVLTGNVLDQGEYYDKLIEAMQLEDRVKITGYLKEEELYAVLNHAKGLIYPSLFEGFGIPLVEAMQMNKLIASSNLTSLPEIGCDSIYYFNPKKPDDILKGIEFLFQSEIDDRIKDDYQHLLERYTIDSMIAGYMEVFQQAVVSRTEEKKSARVRGVYGDGWTESAVEFHMTRRKGDVLHIKFRVPEYFKGKIFVKTGKKAQKYNYSYENANEITEVLKSDKETIQIRLSHTWNPESVLHNGDNRELGVMMESMELVTRERTETIDIV